jgi:hypothetical protein
MTSTPHVDTPQPRDIKTLHRWIALILAHPGLSPITVKTAVALALHLHMKSGQCDVRYETIAEDIAADRRSVIRAVAVLEAAGLILVERSRGGHGNSFLFVFPGEALNGDIQMSLSPESNSDIQTPPTVTKLCHPNGDNRCHPHKELRKENCVKTAEEESISPTPAPDDDLKIDATEESLPEKPATRLAFEAFWEAYPRKVAKLAAEKAFTKARAPAAELVAGAKRYAIEREGQDPKYTKHPATWLNGGGWLDETVGGKVIDQSGNVVAMPQRSRGQTWADVVARRNGAAS